MDPSNFNSVELQRLLEAMSVAMCTAHALFCDGPSRTERDSKLLLKRRGRYISGTYLSHRYIGTRLGIHVGSYRLQEEKKKAMLNELVGKITAVCWDKCITGTPGNKLSSSEASCLSNCAHRYMDLSLTIMKRFQSMQ